MSNVRSYTDQELLDRVHALPSGSGPQLGGIVDIWVRSAEDEYNKFDDKVYTFDCTDFLHPKFVMTCTGTTNAGAEGLKRFDKYNREGCAVLKADELVYQSHAYGLHKGQYPAYRQVKPFPYYRDNDKDDKAEEIGEIHMDMIGANCHKAGWFSTEIGGWSVACLVRNRQSEYEAWMKFMSKRPLTVCILKEF